MNSDHPVLSVGLTPSDQRMVEQRRIMENGEEVAAGSARDLPLPLNDLLSITELSPWVREVRDGGLTAVVFRLSIGGKSYALKRKRPVAKVANFDGQASFLTEVQRRADLMRLKSCTENAAIYDGFIDTIYASYRQGIILSPWIEGGHPLHTFNKPVIESVHRSLYALDRAGLMDWDLCPGNLLEVNNRVIFFDFGYMWPYDPRHHYNTNGLQTPVFHGAERFETRSLCGHLMKLEREEGMEAALSLYRIEKIVALTYYRKRLQWLRDENADAVILDWIQEFIDRWSDGLGSEAALEPLYRNEMFRSMTLDVRDDLQGRSCTPETLRKIERILDMIRHDYDGFRKHGLFVFDDAGLSRDALLEKYKAHDAHARAWQV